MAALRRWLITGVTGQLGGHLACELARSEPGAHAAGLLRPPPAGQTPSVGDADALAARPPGAPPLEFFYADMRDPDAVRASVTAFGPTHIVHAAALTSVAQAAAAPDDAWAVNVAGARALLAAADACRARLVFCSTDMVFDGERAPYREADAPHPRSVYGRTKAAAEAAVLERGGALVVRLPLLYGLPRTRRATTFSRQVDALRRGEELRLFVDEYRTPLALVDAARALLALARSHLAGIVHVAGPQRLSRYELVARTAQVLGIAGPRLRESSRHEAGAGEPRPADLSLVGDRFVELFPDLAPRPVSAETIGEPGA